MVKICDDEDEKKCFKRIFWRMGFYCEGAKMRSLFLPLFLLLKKGAKENPVFSFAPF